MCHKPLDILYRESLVIFSFDIIFFVQRMSCPSLGDIGNKDEKNDERSTSNEKMTRNNGGRETMK